MEFERSLFRVYERSVEGLIREDEEADEIPFYKKSCKIFEVLILIIALFFLFCLIYLHTTYNGQTGCLPQALMMTNFTTNETYMRPLSKDTIIIVKINSKYLSDRGFSKKTMAGDDYVDDHQTSTSTTLRHSFSQIAAQNNNFPTTVATALSSFRFTSLLEKGFLLSHTFPEYYSQKNQFAAFYNHVTSAQSIREAALNNQTSSNTTDNIPDFNQPFDYMITFDWAVTILDNDLKAKHNFELVSIELPGYNCFGADFAESILPIGGLDHAFLNNVINTIQKDGYMFSKYGDLYYWEMNSMHPYHNAGQWLSYKIYILFMSLLAFFLLSSTTALLVRVLISSGVVIVFPLFWLFRLCGMEQINLRIIAISYPWIGLPLQIIRFRNQSSYPFLIAHLMRVIIYYMLYVAAQSVYLKWLYNGTSFIQGQLWLYAVMMIWEYFSMIYVRAVGSIRLFPRVSLGLFLIFHFYYYSFPAGFHLLALMVMFLFLLFTMTFCVRVYEVKAFRQGLVNIDQPRMLYNSLPWPTWRAELGPEYTLFMPVNSRATTVYQNQVPNIRPDANNNNTANNVPPTTNNTTGGDGAGNNNIEMGTINRTDTDPNDNNTRTNPSTSFFARFLTPINYQSINNTSSHDSTTTNNPLNAPLATSGSILSPTIRTNNGYSSLPQQSESSHGSNPQG